MFVDVESTEFFVLSHLRTLEVQVPLEKWKVVAFISELLGIC